MAYGNSGFGSGGYGSGGFGNRPQRSFAPVKMGDELEVRIEAVGEKGDGIAKKDGFVLFVPNTREGDQVRIRITKVLRKVGFAEVVGKGGGGAGKKEKQPEEEESYDSAKDTEDFGNEEESSDEQESSDAPKDQ